MAGYAKGPCFPTCAASWELLQHNRHEADIPLAPGFPFAALERRGSGNTLRSGFDPKRTRERLRRPDNTPAASASRSSSGCVTMSPPGARLVVSYRANCHTALRRSRPRQTTTNGTVFRRRDGNATARLNAGECGRSRTMAITTMIDSPAVATSTAPPARRRGTFGADKLWAMAFVTPYVAV